MEEVFLRFSYLSEGIFSNLDNESIAKSKEVARSWDTYLNKQKFVYIRRIKAIVGKFHKLGDSWRDVLKTASTNTIKVCIDHDTRVLTKKCQMIYM